MEYIDGEACICFLGLPRSGKTLNMTEHCILPHLISGVDVWSNYWINWNLPNIHFWNDKEELYPLRNCVVAMDEIGRVADPREYASEDGNWRAFWQMHGHNHVDLVFNTQHISLVAKSCLIVVDKFYMCEKGWNGAVIKNLWPNFPWVVVHTDQLSLNDVKLLDVPIIGDNDETIQMKNISEDTDWFNKKKLLHRELNDFKSEFVHWRCPQCQSRQGASIPKDQTEEICYFDKKLDRYVLFEDVIAPKCPKHRDQFLDLTESAMYDTDYKLEIIESDVVFKPYVKTLKEVPFRGSLSDSQLLTKKSLERKFSKLK